MSSRLSLGPSSSSTTPPPPSSSAVSPSGSATAHSTVADQPIAQASPHTAGSTPPRAPTPPSFSAAQQAGSSSTSVLPTADLPLSASAASLASGHHDADPMAADAAFAQSLQDAEAGTAPGHQAPLAAAAPATPAGANYTAAQGVRHASQAVVWGSAQAISLYGAFMGFNLGGVGGNVGGAFSTIGALATLGTGILAIGENSPPPPTAGNYLPPHLHNLTGTAHVTSTTPPPVHPLNREPEALSADEVNKLQESLEKACSKPIKDSNGVDRQAEIREKFEGVSKINRNLALKIFDKAEHRESIADLLAGGRLGNKASEKLANSGDENILALYMDSSRAFMSKKRTELEKDQIEDARGDFYLHIINVNSEEARAYFGFTGPHQSVSDGQSHMMNNIIDRLNAWLEGRQNSPRGIGIRNVLQREIKDNPPIIAGLFLRPDVIHIPENATFQEFTRRLLSAQPFVVEELPNAADPTPAPGEAGPSSLVRSLSGLMHRLSSGEAEQPTSLVTTTASNPAPSFAHTPFEIALVKLMETQLMGIHETTDLPKEMIHADVQAVFDDPQLTQHLYQLAAGLPRAVASLAASDKVKNLYQSLQGIGLNQWKSSNDKIGGVAEARAALELIAQPVREQQNPGESKTKFAEHKYKHHMARTKLGLKDTVTISPARYAQLKNMLDRADLRTVSEATKAIKTQELPVVAGDLFKYPEFVTIPLGADVMQTLKKFLELDFRAAA